MVPDVGDGRRARSAGVWFTGKPVGFLCRVYTLRIKSKVVGLSYPTCKKGESSPCPYCTDIVGREIKSYN